MIKSILSHFSPGQVRERVTGLFREKRCPLCRSVHKETSFLCPSCSSGIERSPRDREFEKHYGMFHFSNIYCYASYSGTMREMITAWKFNSRLEFSSVFGCMMKELGTKIPEEPLPELIIPVPLHRSRLLKRGFNQSLVLAESLSDSTGIPVGLSALKRVRKTIAQSTLSGSERRENLLKAFTADNEIVSGKRILLVDDVFTTGSTADECARTLLDSGAAEVEVMVLALALF